MATPAYIAFFDGVKPLPGSVTLPYHYDEPGKLSCTPLLALRHGRKGVWTVKDKW